MTYWREQAETYPCPVCGAKPGQPCATASGKRTPQPHASRGQTADRCPQCHTRLLADQEPGELCARCQLVRRLEVERASYHVRRNP